MKALVFISYRTSKVSLVAAMFAYSFSFTYNALRDAIFPGTSPRFVWLQESIARFGYRLLDL